MPQLPRPARRFAPALSLLLAYGGLAVADDLPTSPDIVPGAASAPPPTCPLGVLKCPKRKVDFSMCTKNDLLDTHVPGLPTDGDRGERGPHIDTEGVRQASLPVRPALGGPMVRRLSAGSAI